MIIVMSKEATGAEIQALTQWVRAAGLSARIAGEDDRIVVRVTGQGFPPPPSGTGSRLEATWRGEGNPVFKTLSPSK